MIIDEKDALKAQGFIKDESGEGGSKPPEGGEKQKPEGNGSGEGGEKPPAQPPKETSPNLESPTIPPVDEGGDDKNKGGGEDKDQQALIDSTRQSVLKEIFGESFASVDDAKAAKIPDVLKQAEVLRQENASLTEKLAKKPKTDFVNDEMALFNEFVRTTGVDNYRLFKQINTADINSMEALDVLVAKHILEHPAESPSDIREYFEMKYKLNDEDIDEKQKRYQKTEMNADADKARKSLLEVKNGLKMPEPPEEEPTEPKGWTEEQTTKQKTVWNNWGDRYAKSLQKLNIPIVSEDGKTAKLLDYELSAEEQQQAKELVVDYAVKNQVELNQDNVNTIGRLVYKDIMFNKIPHIVHAVFEHARTLTEEQVHSIYDYPSIQRNTDKPPARPPSKETEAELANKKAFEAEMGRF